MPLIARIFATLLIAAVLPLKADQITSEDGFVIHYATFSSLIIPAKVAEAHGITRSRSRVVTNISIRNHLKPVKARVSGTATNLLAQSRQLDFVEVVENNAVYYLATNVINENDSLQFEITVQPEPAGKAFHFAFTRQYY